MNRIRLEVCPQKRAAKRWKVTKDSATYAEFDIKVDAIGAAVLLAKQLEARGEWITLKIKGLDGKIVKNGERTYPRSSDPRRSKG